MIKQIKIILIQRKKAAAATAAKLSSVNKEIEASSKAQTGAQAMTEEEILALAETLA